MAPQELLQTDMSDDGDIEVSTEIIQPEVKTSGKDKLRLLTENVLVVGYLHLVALYGLYLSFTSAKIATIIFAIFVHQLGKFGVTAGAHRLWSHRSYKAKWPLRVILIILQTLTFQYSAISWAKDHRVHHKFTDTDADPYNIKRGFFFAQLGWILYESHPEFKRKLKTIDISDLMADPLLVFQDRYYYFVMPLITFVVPTLIPIVLWNETFLNAFCINVLQFICTVHTTGFINSVAHLWGSKPYDRFISPTENVTVALLAGGEGFHNYHHTFPWDYKNSEWGKNAFNWAAAFIEFFAKIGWAYDLKTVSDEMVRTRIHRTGDGKHDVWGWGDKDQPKEDHQEATILHQKTL